jgi:hypothetical protein
MSCSQQRGVTDFKTAPPVPDQPAKAKDGTEADERGAKDANGADGRGTTDGEKEVTKRRQGEGSG